MQSFKFLGVHISDDLSWSVNTSALVKKAQQRLHFLRVLRREHLNAQLLVTFYRSTIESLLTYAVALQLHGGRQEETAEGGKRRAKNHRLPSAFLKHHLRLPLSKQGQRHPEEHHPARLPSLQPGASGPYMPEQIDSGTASFPKLSPDLH